jgi:hypothetical protein
MLLRAYAAPLTCDGVCVVLAEDVIELDPEAVPV